MRAQTITTKAWIGGKGRTKWTIVPRGVLTLSLAVVLLVATASTASTTPTPPAPPLTLSLALKDDHLDPGWHSPQIGCCWLLTQKLKLRATTSNDSTLVARGDVKRTTNQLVAGEGTKFTANLKQSKWEQLKEEEEAPKPVRLKAKIKVKATDEFGQTVTDEFKLKFLRRCAPSHDGRPCH
jgi:hypothetical protein